MSDHNPGLRPWRDIARRQSRQIMVGNVPVGGDAPITVQTMTNTDTEDVAATIAQVLSAQKAGADLVRISVPTLAAAKAFGEIKKAVGYFPLIADIHFNYKCGLAAAEAGADCLRINPGNIGNERKVDEIVACARMMVRSALPCAAARDAPSATASMTATL